MEERRDAGCLHTEVSFFPGVMGSHPENLNIPFFFL